MRTHTVRELETNSSGWQALAGKGQAASIAARMVWTLLAMLIASLLTVAAQDERPAETDRPNPIFLGPLDCDRCHSRRPSPLEQEKGLVGFVMQQESSIWIDKDKHSLAMRLIDFRDVADEDLTDSQRLSQQICERLGISDIHAARQCLSCHANWVEGSEPPPFYERGVTCESCHGPSSLWTRDHTELSWRQKSPQEKYSDYGFVVSSQVPALHLVDFFRGCV